RCVFHFIDFPDAERMRRIVEVHHPGLDDQLADQAIKAFYRLRDTDRLRKRPSTSELIDWLLVLARAEIAPDELTRAIPFLGVLLKKEQDHTSVAAARSGKWRS
ncbi:MAG: MoxR family ATPase, partial [Verrucomicrobiae bacterium]|nr:MoxR family ATPase [Verrucomicrobiae bacterium]